MSILAAIFRFVRAILRRRGTLALENLALSQQLAVLRRSAKRLWPAPHKSVRFMR